MSVSSNGSASRPSPLDSVVREWYGQIAVAARTPGLAQHLVFRTGELLPVRGEVGLLRLLGVQPITTHAAEMRIRLWDGAAFGAGLSGWHPGSVSALVVPRL